MWDDGDVTLPLRGEGDLVRGRRRANEAARFVGLDAYRSVRLVTAVSELGRNTLRHGGGGTMTIAPTEDRRGLIVRFDDGGPGIGDITAALRDGWSSGGGLGLGLPGAGRLVDRMNVVNRPEGGTTVTIWIWN